MNSRSISGGVPTPQFLFIHAVKGWDVASNPHRACACGCIDCKKLGLANIFWACFSYRSIGTGYMTNALLLLLRVCSWACEIMSAKSVISMRKSVTVICVIQWFHISCIILNLHLPKRFTHVAVPADSFNYRQALFLLEGQEVENEEEN